MYRRVLCPIDSSPTSDKGLEHAIALAREQRAALRLVHVVDLGFAVRGFDGTVIPQAVMDSLRDDGRRLLDAALSHAKDAGIEVDTASEEIATGRVADAILRQADEWQADLIVMGTHGRGGLDRVMLGSDAESVARRAKVPVLLLPPGAR